MPPTCHTLLNGMQSAQMLHREADRVLSDPTLLKQSRPLQKTDATRSRPAFFRGPRAHSVRQHLLVKAESAATKSRCPTNLARRDTLGARPGGRRTPARRTTDTPHFSLHTARRPSCGTRAPSPNASAPRPAQRKVQIYVRRSRTRCSVSGHASRLPGRARALQHAAEGGGGSLRKLHALGPQARPRASAHFINGQRSPRPIEVRHYKRRARRSPGPIGENEARKGARLRAHGRRAHPMQVRVRGARRGEVSPARSLADDGGASSSGRLAEADIYRWRGVPRRRARRLPGRASLVVCE